MLFKKLMIFTSFRELRVQRISSESLQLCSGRGIIELPRQGSAVYGDSRSGAVITVDPSTGESGGIIKPFTLGQNTPNCPKETLCA